MPIVKYKIVVEKPLETDKEGNSFIKHIQGFAPTLPQAVQDAEWALEGVAEGVVCKIYEVKEELLQTLTRAMVDEKRKKKGEVKTNG